MKQAAFFICAIFFFSTSCNNTAGGDTMEAMKNIQNETGKKGEDVIPTTLDGYTMSAKINGKNGLQMQCILLRMLAES